MASTSTLSTRVTRAFDGIAPSNPSTPGPSSLPYDVFINHRGVDVKRTLVTTIYHILSNIGLEVFVDEEKLLLGDYLPETIEEAMRKASVHIAVFSKNYAQSSWCLAELAFMLETGTKIIPVFYYVQPADLRWASTGKGIYADSFSRHELKGRYTNQLQRWKMALYQASFYSGHIINNDEDEKRLLKIIVNRVLDGVKYVPFEVAKYPVGLDEAVEDFEKTTLQYAQGHQSVQSVGICGMGGSGKTTLAKALYNRRYSSFDRSSFLFDIREAAIKGLLHYKQMQLLDDLGVKFKAFDNIEQGKRVLAMRLRSVRVFIVLDDVDHIDQLHDLLPPQDCLGRGSLIVVTTREKEILTCRGISSIYKMRPLGAFHAMQLFCWHAFIKPRPPQGFEKLAEQFVKACAGLPLSLKVIGAQLYGKSEKYWESQLQKIARTLPNDIQSRLKISYDALDKEEKEAFLDIACFFCGEEKNSAIAVWDGSGWSGLCAWQRLVNKCLAELDNGGRIRMHDHLRDLGREITNHHSPYCLWSPQQIINVDNEAQGIAIRGIMSAKAQSTSEVERFPRCSQGGELIVNTSRGFRRLAPSSLGLKILEVRGNNYNQVIGDLARELVWLRWFDPQQRNLASLGSLKNLRVLELYAPHSLEELWETDSDAPEQLRELIISGCSELQGFPKSIGRLRHLKKIVVSGSLKMRSLPEEFCLLQSLENLDLSGCSELSSLPSGFGDLRNLRHLDMSYCQSLRSLPVSFKELIHLQHLNLLCCTNLTFESDMLENIRKLEFLSMHACSQLEELPHHIINQVSLRKLDLLHTRLREVPMNIGQLSKLRIMNIGSQLLTSLPRSIGGLSSLTSLILYDCSKLKCLPDSLGRLNLLKELMIVSSEVKSLPKSVSQLINLQTLNISCPISELDLGAGLFTSLKCISLESTKVSKIYISEDCCPSLETLLLHDNGHLTEIEVLPTKVEDIKLDGCKMLRNIRAIDGLVNIQKLSIIGCPKLDTLPSVGHFASLQEFVLKNCYGVKKIQGLEQCRALETLRADTRWEEAGIESLKRMERLRIVHLRAINRSGVEGCIQSMQKCPAEEIIVCTRAVPDAALLVNSFAFHNLSVVDSFANKKIKSNPSFKWASNARCILICFVVNCESPKTLLELTFSASNHADGEYTFGNRMELEEGKWVWTALFTQHSRFLNHISCLTQSYHTQSRVYICREYQEVEGEVEKGLLATGEDESVMEAFTHLCLRLSNGQAYLLHSKL